MPPMSELKHDMELLQQNGFNLVKLQEHWMLDEPREGHYDFSRYEELIEHAATLDMGVYLGLTCEQAPPWLWRKHPDCRMIGRNGVPVAYEAHYTLPADGKPGPCYDHPGARADMERFIRRLVQTLGKYENIVVWNTWQEIGYWAEGLVGTDVCYCPHTLVFFREWLMSKYGDLDQLNREWNVRYGDWEDVAPNRGVRKGCSFPQEIAWNTFMSNAQIARVLQARAQTIREADPMKRPVFAHVGAPVVGSGQDWTYARSQDFLGSSCYPAWGPFHGWDDGHVGRERKHEQHACLLTEMAQQALKFDYLRSANPHGAPVWAAEFQGGPVSTGLHKGRVPAAADIRRWMLTAVGSGVTAISFWVTRAEIAAAEANGYSLLDSTGDTTERFEEAARVGKALKCNADIFGRPTWPGAAVAILIDDNNYRFCNSLPDGAGHFPYSVRGWHSLLWEAGIPMDFIEVSQLADKFVENYQALILPFPLSLAEPTAEKLAQYVEQGGDLISEACAGRINEHGYCVRGELSPAMRDLFGVQHENLTMVREPEDGARWSPAELGSGEYLDAAMLSGAGVLEGHSLRANVYIETFTCNGSQPVLKHGDAVAGTVRTAGNGRAWLLGTFAGHSGTAYKDEETRDAVRTILAECGVTPAHDGRLLLRKRVAGNREAWLFTNITKQTVTEQIIVADTQQVADLFGEDIGREGNKISLEVKSLDVRVLIVSNGQ